MGLIFALRKSNLYELELIGLIEISPPIQKKNTNNKNRRKSSFPPIKRKATTPKRKTCVRMGTTTNNNCWFSSLLKKEEKFFSVGVLHDLANLLTPLTRERKLIPFTMCAVYMQEVAWIFLFLFCCLWCLWIVYVFFFTLNDEIRKRTKKKQYLYGCSHFLYQFFFLRFSTLFFFFWILF